VHFPAARLLEPAPVRIGISGWNYAPWRRVFYPEGLRQRDELSFASTVFPSIEINGSFYSLVRPESCQAWYEATPREFVFAVKGSRFITHMKRLANVEVALANFFASGLLRLREKFGPILWQLPPRFRFDPERLEKFLKLLPRSLGEAARLARHHDARVAGRTELKARVDGPLRYALEVRHPSFEVPEYPELLRRHGIASCAADAAKLFPLIEDVTADFVYVRLHGSERLYTSGYGSEELTSWALKIRAWQCGAAPAEARHVGPVRAPNAALPVFCYFDNDVKVRAPFDAINLMRAVSGLAVCAPPPALETVLEEPRTGWVEWESRPTKR
jgi:uncharacterized protein YecE (DUF72 family)